MIRLLICATSLTFVVTSASAEKNVPLEPRVAKIGSPTLVESFDGDLGKSFQAAKGVWGNADGVLQGQELKADKHAAVLNFQKKNRNSVVRFSFKLDDETKGFHFSLNHKGGHLFRTVVTPTKLTINLDKDKKDPKSKAKVLANSKGNFEQGQWYTMQIEMVGDRVVVQTDNGITAEAQNAKLDTNKPNYRFVMRGKTLSIDDLSVWELE